MDHVERVRSDIVHPAHFEKPSHPSHEHGADISQPGRAVPNVSYWTSRLRHQSKGLYQAKRSVERKVTQQRW
jgi:hypothetical protein